MTTAELIKKREEERNMPIQRTAPDLSSMVAKIKPTDVTIQRVNNDVANMSAAKNTAQEKSINRQIDAGNTPVTSAAAMDALKKAPEPISLYEIGKSNASTGIADAEKRVNTPSPINTKEMEEFRNQVIGVRDFGVETPEQAAARERRDYIKQGLTGLTEGLSSLANLYYTTKWAPNQKMVSQMPLLQQRLYRERIERDKRLDQFRAWQRAKADKDADRAYQNALFDKKQEAANKAAALKHNRDLLLAEIKNQLELGKIDKKKAADLELQAAKAKSAQDLEKIKFGYGVALKKTTSASDDKVVDSAIGSDGNIYTRNSKLTDNEAMQIVQSSVPDDEFQSFVTKEQTGDDLDGNPIYKTKIDWRAAAAYALQKGYVTPEELEQMGFKKGKSKSKGKEGGFSYGKGSNQNNQPKGYSFK